MKIIVKLLIIFFLSFLSAPSIISLIDKKGDISFFYDNSETEEFQKEIKTDFIFDPFTFLVFNPQKKSSKILSDNISKHDNILREILISPPDII
ncbi:MAG: hypothetical protein EXR18_04060 [Flavobacteriaceae bacterium]|nr:hypothetical protein [Flavobacteriaceae bacterium]